MLNIKNIVYILNNNYEFIVPMRLIRHTNNTFIEKKNLNNEFFLKNNYIIIKQIQYIKKYLEFMYSINFIFNKNKYLFNYTLKYINFDDKYYEIFDNELIYKYYHKKANISKFINKLIKDNIIKSNYIHFISNKIFFWENIDYFKRSQYFFNEFLDLIKVYLISDYDRDFIYFIYLYY